MIELATMSSVCPGVSGAEFACEKLEFTPFSNTFASLENSPTAKLKTAPGKEIGTPSMVVLWAHPPVPAKAKPSTLKLKIPIRAAIFLIIMPALMLDIHPTHSRIETVQCSSVHRFGRTWRHL